MRHLVAWTEETQNEAMLDPWSLVHGAAGLAAGLLGLPVWASVAAATVYEVVEGQFERPPRGQAFFHTSGPESLANQLADVALFAVGAWAGRQYKGNP